jgi:predicted component of type VI protein secretion system
MIVSRDRLKEDRILQTLGLLRGAGAEHQKLLAVALLWFGSECLVASQREARGQAVRLCDRVRELIAEIDRLVSRQVDAVLHRPEFQALEGNWRGIRWLVEAVEQAKKTPRGKVIVKVFAANRSELESDTEPTLKDSSSLFKQIYDEGLGRLGGEPIGLLLTDLEIGPDPADKSLVNLFTYVGAAALCPVVCQARPKLVGPDFRHWHQLQEWDPREEDSMAVTKNLKLNLTNMLGAAGENARYLYLVLPRVLMRAPHPLQTSGGFVYREQVAHSDVSDDALGEDGEQRYLWGNPAYALGVMAIKSFKETGWFAAIRGARIAEPGNRNKTPSGPRDDGEYRPWPELIWKRSNEALSGFFNGREHERGFRFPTDPEMDVMRPITDVLITDEQDARLSAGGLVSLCACPGTALATFYHINAVHHSIGKGTAEGLENERISAMLPNLLCACRFAHYLVWLGNRKIGSTQGPEQLQSELENWIREYQISNPENIAQQKAAERPLRGARVSVTTKSLGIFELLCELQPHFMLDYLTVDVKLKTRLGGPPKGNHNGL